MNERSVWSDEMRWLIFMSYVDVLVGIRLVNLTTLYRYSHNEWYGGCDTKSLFYSFDTAYIQIIDHTLDSFDYVVDLLYTLRYKVAVGVAQPTHRHEQ